MTVVLGPEDRQPPGAPGELKGEPGDLPSGEAWVSWRSPADRGEAGLVGFFVTVDGKEVPRYLVPPAAQPGALVRMHLRDMALEPGRAVDLAVRAVDGAGNVSPAAQGKFKVSARKATPLPGAAPQPFKTTGALPRLGDAEVAVIDELDKIQPISGAMIPKQAEGYLAANHLWDAQAKQIRLHAARNEFVAFQVVLMGPATEVRPTLTFEGHGSRPLKVEFGRYQTVATKNGPLPDPIVPLGDRSYTEAPGQRSRSLHVEIYVAHDTKPGEYKGSLVLASGARRLVLPVFLQVWSFTLPDKLSFLPEMNCYDLPANERAYYRLAHRHRTVLNRVPYHQNGRMSEGCAPAWDGTRLEWSAWDRRFGPYFDGSAFADLPRAGVPLECFYLPLHENWPSPIEPSYNGDYWADRAFPGSYRQAFIEASRQIAEHVHAKKWSGTLFQCFFNGKNDFKKNGWSRGSSPWLLDEPANFQDYWALRYFGLAFHEGTNLAKGSGKLVYRCDISRPQWQRDALDGVLDYNVVGAAFRTYRRMVLDRKEVHGGLVIEYGGTNALEDSNIQPAAWCVDAWTLGTDGVLPWQTIGTAESWKHADELALFYPGRGGSESAPVPSVRLKAYRRGQQDIEYLTLLGRMRSESRWATGFSIRQAMGLAAERHASGFTSGEDAGRIQFARLKPQDLWSLRVQVGQAINNNAQRSVSNER
jgi:hypothetical protein